MGEDTKRIALRVVLLGVLGAGWVAGLLGQRAIVEETDYLDISPPLLLLGTGLCVLAGAAARLVARRSRGLRTGALAGVAMMATMVAGYVGLALAYADRFDADAGGETWFSLLLESWFWIGVPIIVSAMLGAVGWLVTAAYLDRGGRSHPA
jgi:hypothetical protein